MSLPQKKEISHVIFDYDGVMQDTETVYSVANDIALKKYGRSFNNILKAGMMGRKKSEAVQWVLQQTGLADTVTTKQYDEVYEQTLDELLPNSPILPGVEKLLNYFVKIKIPLAICTGSNTHEYEQKTKKLKEFLKPIPLVVLAGDDPEIKNGKPAPDPYLVTMSRFPNPPKNPENVLVFEDSLNGVRSSLAAGCTTIFIPQQCFKTHDWEERISDVKPRVAEYLNSLEEFDPKKYSFP